MARKDWTFPHCRFVYWFTSRIARMLDRNPNACWAYLAMWSMGYYPLLSILFPDRYDDAPDYWHQQCRSDNDGTPYAYCGKCEHTGRFRRAGPRAGEDG